MRIKLAVWSLLIGLNIMYVIFLQLSPNKDTLFNYLFNASYALVFIFASVVAASGLRKRSLSTKLGKAMFFYMVSFLSYAMGLFIWTFYNVVLKQPIPYPGMADVFFILFQPACFLGFIFLVRGFGGEFKLRSVIEFLLLFSVIFVLLYSFLSLSSIGPELPLLERILNITYPSQDALLVALVITGLRTERGRLHLELLIFVLGALIMVFADTIFSYRFANGVYWNGDVSDILFFISASIQGLGMISLMSLGETERVVPTKSI
jgi:hypothetical protein